MVETASSQTSDKHQLQRLLRDPDFLKLVDLLTREVMHAGNVPNQVARGFVLFTAGEPNTLMRVYKAWILARSRGESLGRAKLILRRRVFDLLREGAR